MAKHTMAVENYFQNVIKKSWTWEKLTEEEQKRFTDMNVFDRIKGNDDTRVEWFSILKPVGSGKARLRELPSVSEQLPLIRLKDTSPVTPSFRENVKVAIVPVAVVAPEFKEPKAFTYPL